MSNFLAEIEPMKPAIDGAAAGVTIASVFGALPHITAALSLVWVLIRIYETRTIQSLLKRMRKPNDPSV